MTTLHWVMFGTGNSRPSAKFILHAPHLPIVVNGAMSITLLYLNSMEVEKMQ